MLPTGFHPQSTEIKNLMGEDDPKSGLKVTSLELMNTCFLLGEMGDTSWSAKGTA